MNKYLKGFLNLIIMLVVGFVGTLFSLNVLAFGFIGFPEVMMKTGEILLSNPSWFAYYFVPGTLPLFFLLAMLSLAIFSMFLTIRLIKSIDIEGIISATKSKKNEK